MTAAERMIARSGVNEIGVNAIAREAGVDKVLVYRYFGGLPQLLATLGSNRELWPRMSEVARGEDALGAALLAALLEVGRALIDHPLPSAAAAAELMGRNTLTDALAAAREAEGERLLELLRTEFAAPPYLDLQALAALLSAALICLTLHSRTGAPFLGIDTSSDDGWRRIEKTLEAVVRALLDARE